MISFPDDPRPIQEGDRPIAPDMRVVALEQELAATRADLQHARQELAISRAEQAASDEAAVTVRDLQNVLYSTNIATILLDRDLCIRLFTPATRSIFGVIPGDIGRPLADLRSLADDDDLLPDARAVLRSGEPVEREINARNGAWFRRCIVAYCSQDKEVSGVVITFNNITEQRSVADALGIAMQQAELANAGKSRFLAAASHDLRQPLQTLTLLQGMLAKTVQGDAEKKLVARIDEALGAMLGMLDTLLDINEIETGGVHVEMADFPIDLVFDKLRDQFTHTAEAQGLTLRVVPSSRSVHSDPRLLELMIRNLVSNALKYTRRGKVLLGCRSRGGKLNVEVWDTGIGIAGEDLQTIFDEYHQIDNAARERSRGLGLGLSIVRRLGEMLNHPVAVQSRPGKGSVFSVEVASSGGSAPRQDGPVFSVSEQARLEHAPQGDADRSGVILIVDDDPAVRELLDLFLRYEGHRVLTAPDGVAALDMVAREAVRPDLLLTDLNLPGGLNGLQVAAMLRDKLHHTIPVIVLTGDTSTATTNAIVREMYEQLSKPVKPRELTQMIKRLLPPPPAKANSGVHAAKPASGSAGPVIFVVDDEDAVRDAICSVLEQDGRFAESYASCEAFLAAYRPGRPACLLVDATLPGMSGIELLRRLGDAGHRLPAIMITGDNDVSMAVQAMRAGATDFLGKPFGRDELLASVERALDQLRDASKLPAWRQEAAGRVAGLTPRQREIMERVLAGHPSKNIAADLGISQRTVENHRAAIMQKTGSKSIPALARVAFAAAGNAAVLPSV